MNKNEIFIFFRYFRNQFDKETDVISSSFVKKDNIKILFQGNLIS